MSEQRSEGIAVLLAFLGGAVAGAVLGLLFAPKSGAETREQVAEFARRTREKAEGLAGAAREKLGV